MSFKNNSQQHQLSPTECYMEFQAGVTACLRSWSALRTAVESGWGGGTRESHIKGETLRQNILQWLDGKKTPSSLDVYDFADELAIFMEEEFSVTLEDQSEQQVAETLFRLYEDCLKGDLTLARQLVVNAEGIVAFNHQYPVQIQSNENDDDEDDEDTMADRSAINYGTTSSIADVVAAPMPPTPSSTLSPAEYAMQPLFGKAVDAKPAIPSGPVRQLGESIPEESTMEVDEDGFAPVCAKGKKNRRGAR